MRTPGTGIRRRRAARLAAVFAPALLLVASALAAAGSPPSTVPSPVFSEYDSGRLNIVFPSPLPGVELFQDANSSIGAALYVEHVLELQPGNSTHPTVVQVASLTSTTPFNRTSATSGQNSFGLSLNGSFKVARVNEPLWTPSTLQNISSPFAPLVGGASLRVNYSLLHGVGDSEGVGLSWSIVHWPWVSDHDLLGVELRFVVLNATRFSACTSAPAINGSATQGCNGTVLSPGGILWNASGVGSVAGSTAAGLTAEFSWGSQSNTSTTSPRPVTVGTYYVNASTTRLTLAAPADGAGNVTTAARFVLSTPLPPVLAPILASNGPAYATAAAVFTVAAIGGVVWFRRSERRAREEL
ncbi:MAG TPA: hypothetical protein VGV89_08660 [Thermoplasmata archaeon]|nr:hypothetical protein [Thermoplasmata archaeon]